MYTLNEDIRIRNLGEIKLLVNIKTNALNKINNFAYDILLTICDNKDNTYEKLKGKYCVDESTLKNDIDNFINALIENNIIRKEV